MRNMFVLGVFLGMLGAAVAGWGPRETVALEGQSSTVWTNKGLPVSAGGILVRGGSGSANTVTVSAVQGTVTGVVGVAAATNGTARVALDKDRVRLYTSDKLILQWVVTNPVTVVLDPYAGE